MVHALSSHAAAGGLTWDSKADESRSGVGPRSRRRSWQPAAARPAGVRGGRRRGRDRDAVPHFPGACGCVARRADRLGSRRTDRGLRVRDQWLRGRRRARGLAGSPLLAGSVGQRNSARRSGVAPGRAAGAVHRVAGQVRRRAAGDRGRTGARPRRPERTDGCDRGPYRGKVRQPQMARRQSADRGRRGCGPRGRVQRAHRGCGIRAGGTGAAVRTPHGHRRAGRFDRCDLRVAHAVR